MSSADEIKNGKAVIGIEFGSTRIKAVLIGEDHSPLASGVHDWQNEMLDGVWTYSLDNVRKGLQECFADLMKNVEEAYGIKLETAAAIGISAMMHGYLAFDEKDKQLVPFRTWRNTMTEEAADKLTEEFSFNIPQRWSIAHLYQAMLNKEPHVGDIAFMTTLAGYVHYILTGEKVIGAGDASGIFPIDSKTCDYNSAMMSKFDKLAEGTALNRKLADILPRIVPAGECAGRLTAEGAKLLDPTGTFGGDIPFCPPEGDAQTGMAATNSITPRTGNVSAGTSIFSMIVLEKDLSAVHREIDIVTTPCGDPVAMVHCNSCTSDLDAWFGIFGGFLKEIGVDMPKGQLYDKLYSLAAEGAPDCNGVISYNYYAGEPVTGVKNGLPLLMRSPDTAFNIRDFMRSLVYSCVAALKAGNDILTEQEHVSLERIYAHGGFFKTPVPTQKFLAAALGADVTLMQTAGEGGAWGIALLASYMANRSSGEKLTDYLSGRVFADMKGSTVSPDKEDVDGLNAYMKKYLSGLSAVRAAASED
ncbi:xylulokinase [Ruminococcus flavefaciens]|uniref:Sugar (Pentulose or hexulose) kinase n=1 Tax=Ruminococcus flavefaciens TaxID=1265 RepID=A0A1K1MZL6_RUMFL|nr:FGGY-family carbohydrate kinase [Ruminococcus flavefaciens]SFW28421.1 Sugar (pentulose or hexulose) kinase [Ruminococcus flavefaciens]